MLRWPELDVIARALPLPPGLEARQLSRADIPEVIRSLRAWYPGIERDGERCHCEPSFYAQHVALAGEADGVRERPVYALLLRERGEAISFGSFDYDEASTIAGGRVVAVAPRQRGRGLGRVSDALGVALVRALGASLITGWVTLKNISAQHVAERDGYALDGILPVLEPAEIEGGAPQYVVEGACVNILTPARVEWPDRAALRPEIAELMRMMYDGGGP